MASTHSVGRTPWKRIVSSPAVAGALALLSKMPHPETRDTAVHRRLTISLYGRRSFVELFNFGCAFVRFSFKLLY
jgi:hypothetical protein